LSITALQRAGERASLAAIARVSKTVDPQEPDGVSESAILHNDEAYALYRQHAGRRRRPVRKSSPIRRIEVGDDNRIRASADRDRGRARQRYLRVSKSDLVERLLIAGNAYTEMENRWLRTADDLLVWIIVLDRLVASSDPASSCANPYQIPVVGDNNRHGPDRGARAAGDAVAESLAAGELGG
jgi:hypothetical protein